jgi:grpE
LSKDEKEMILEKEVDLKESTDELEDTVNEGVSPKTESIETVNDSFMEKLEENKKSEEELQLKELTDSVKRIQAEFINYKRRTEQEKEMLSSLANERIILDLLSVLDNFQRGLDAIEEKEGSLYEGMTLIYKQLLSTLEKNGVQEIDTTIEFNPNFHHAVMQEEGEESGKILEVFQKGYLLKDKVIRPAMVKVSN